MADGSSSSSSSSVGSLSSSSPSLSLSSSGERPDTPETAAITDLLEALSDTIHDAETADDAVAALDELTAFLQFVLCFIHYRYASSHIPLACSVS